MKYKLICIDMDGTLLGENHTVSNENKEALKKATELGVKVAITTGRLFTSAKAYSDLVGVEAPIISSNGAYIREKDKEEIIYQSLISKENLEKIYSIIKKYDFLTYFNTSDTVITEIELPETHGYKIMNKKLPEDKRVKIELVKDFKEVFKQYEDKILKAICIDVNNSGNLEKLRRELEELNEFEIVSSWANNIEIMNKETSKGEGVEILSEILGVKREEVICIGDGENDLSMINYAGLGVAMGNASDYVKKQADYITDTNTNNGVAKVIDKFILEK